MSEAPKLVSNGQVSVSEWLRFDSVSQAAAGNGNWRRAWHAGRVDVL